MLNQTKYVMKKLINFKTYAISLLAAGCLVACMDESVNEPAPANQPDPDVATEEQTHTIELYNNFVRVLRDIESDSIMSYSDFEREYLGTDREERTLLEEEVNEALKGIDASISTNGKHARMEGNCKSNVVSRLTHSRFKALGRSRARISWSNKARQKYGWSYRKWSKAKNKGYQLNVDGTQFLLYKYRAYGTPCN